MCWKTRLRAGGILGMLVVSLFILVDHGPGVAAVCANVADDCLDELGSVCWNAGGVPLLDHGKP